MNGRRAFESFSILTVFALMAACGGGGGGGGGLNASAAYPGPSASMSPATDAEATNLASTAYIALDSMVFQPPLRVSSGSGIHPISVRQVRGYMRGLTAAMAAGKSGNCGGGGTFSTSYTGDGTAGSTMTISFNNCIDGPTTRLNGTYFEKVTSGNASTPNYGVSVSINHFKLEEISSGTPTGNYMALTGAYDYSAADDGAGSSSETLAGSLYYGFVNSHTSTNIQTLMKDFNLATTTNAAGDQTFSEDVTISSNLIGGTVVIDTVTPFLTPAANTYPQSGQMIVTGEGNRKVRLTADGAAVSDPDHVLIEWDLNADGTYEASLSAHFGSPWSPV